MQDAGEQGASNGNHVIAATTERGTDLTHDALEVHGVETAVAPTGRADTDQRDVRDADGGRDIVRHRDPPVGDPLRQQVVQSRLADRRASAGHERQFVLIHVDADHAVSGSGQTGGGHGSDISKTEDGDVHGHSNR